MAEMVNGPRVTKPVRTHGTIGGYSAGCKCKLCIPAGRSYHQERKNAQRIGHPNPSEYARENYICKPTPASDSPTGTVIQMPNAPSEAPKRDAETGAKSAPPTRGPQRNVRPDETTTVVTPQSGGTAVEDAVMAEADSLGALQRAPGQTENARSMARILDNQDLVTIHPATSRQLHTILAALRADSTQKRKGGRLASVQNMVAKPDREAK